MTTTQKRILDYGYYCDLVELNNGDLRIDVTENQKEKIYQSVGLSHNIQAIEDMNEGECFSEVLEEFKHLEFISDISEDGRFNVLTSSCGIYHAESNRLWFYPNYQIHNIFQKLMEDREVTFSLAESK